MRYLTRKAALAAITAAALLALAMLVAACGSSSSSTSSSAPTGEATAAAPSEAGGETETTASTTGSCGTIPPRKADDPGNLLAKLNLPKKMAHYYEGWDHPIEASAWADWKPSGGGPFKVAFVGGVVPNEFYGATQKEILSKLEESGLVEKNIPVTTPSSFTAVGEQLQQYNAAVQQEPDLIIFDPMSPTSEEHYVELAGKKGIPTVSIFNPIDNAYNVSVVRNSVVDADTVAAQIIEGLGDEGKVLEVLGTPTAATTVDEKKAWDEVFAACPGIEIVGSAEGEYSTTVAKTATLQFLSTHPGEVDAVIQSAQMAQGIMQAFEQAGHPMPIIGQIQAEKSVTAYWAEHAAEGYKGAAVAGGSADLSNLVSEVVLRMLEGQGPKLNVIPWPLPPVTEANLEEFVDPSWTPTTPGTVNNLPKYEFSEAELNTVFNDPKKGG